MRLCLNLAGLSLPALILALAGCVAPTGPSEGPAASGPPVLGAADGGDRADRSCQIVLRTMYRRLFDDGVHGLRYEIEEASDGTEWFVFRGTLDVDVDALSDGYSPEVLYLGDDGNYWSVRATERVEGAPAGFQRFGFALTRHTASPGWSEDRLWAARVELIPYLLYYDVSERIFDHNRIDNEFTNYVIESPTNFTINDAPEVCAPVEQPTPDWVGNPRLEVTRYSSHPCAESREFDGRVDFGEGTRQRAGRSNICFEVYEPGLTDAEVPDLWRRLSVQAHIQLSPTSGETRYVDLAGREGNNARYAFELRDLDPFDWRHVIDGCPPGPVTVVERPAPPNDHLVQAEATLQVYFTANGVELRREGGAPFEVRYSGYAAASCFPGH